MIIKDEKIKILQESLKCSKDAFETEYIKRRSAHMKGHIHGVLYAMQVLGIEECGQEPTA